MGSIIPAALGIRLLPHRAGESGVMMKVERKCKIVSKEKMGDAIYMVLEVGDMVRTSSAAAAEDEKDLSKVYSKKEYFEQLVKGYLEGAKFLNECEKDNLAFAGRLSTFEVGIRFLADYLKGDTYFHTAYEDHNLVRARTQFKMVQSMEDQAAEYEAIVAKYR